MKKFLILLSTLLLSVQAQAALMSGGVILADTTILQEDGLNEANFQQAFNEKQSVYLTSDLTITNHYGSTTILAGTTVDSHIIFLNTASGSASKTNTWTFDGEILAVLEDDHGLEMAATDTLFANGTYFTGGTGITSGSGFQYQGLEIGLFGAYDNFSILSMTDLEVKMSVSEPGDWIRVITTSAVPVPAALFLFAPALLGLLGLRRKVSSTVA
jgi:hypothetical protein